MANRILSSGVVVVRRQGPSFNYLLLRAYEYWDFPKGQVESGESPLEAALREVCEETTIADLNFRWGEVYRQTAPYNRGRKIARYYIAETAVERVQLPINPALGRPEHSDYRWVSRDEAWELITPRVQAVLRWSEQVLKASQDVRQTPDSRLTPPANK